jgi:hypothetical protein
MRCSRSLVSNTNFKPTSHLHYYDKLLAPYDPNLCYVVNTLYKPDWYYTIDTPYDSDWYYTVNTPYNHDWRYAFDTPYDPDWYYTLVGKCIFPF